MTRRQLAGWLMLSPFAVSFFWALINAFGWQWVLYGAVVVAWLIAALYLLIW